MDTKTGIGRHVRLGAVVLALVVAGAVHAPAAERTRELTREFPAGARSVRLSNLLGHARLVAGSGSTVRVVATVHADGGTAQRTQKLLQSIRWAEERHDGHTDWVLTYPVDDERRFRSLDGVWSGTTWTEYRGRRVRIGRWLGSEGPLLYVDLQIEVPEGAGLVLEHRIGSIDAAGVQANLTLDSSSADVRVSDHTGSLTVDTGSGAIDVTAVAGDVNLDTGSGRIELHRARGSVLLDTGSGDILAEDLDGSRIVADTGSGDVILRRTRAQQEVVADTGSGNVLLEDVDAERLEIDTGSGDVTLSSPLALARSIVVDTGSGDIEIFAAQDASFHLTADQGSGDLRSGFADARPIADGRYVVGYERGDGRTRIEVDTGSGDCIIEPAG